MKEKLLKALSTLPFCIPFPFILLWGDYYLNDARFVSAVAVIIGILSFEYALKGKIKEILAGSSIGFLISLIINSFANNSFDESWFKPLTSTSYVCVLFGAVLIIEGVWILLAKLFAKIKSKIKK